MSHRVPRDKKVDLLFVEPRRVEIDDPFDDVRLLQALPVLVVLSDVELGVLPPPRKHFVGDGVDAALLAKPVGNLLPRSFNLHPSVVNFIKLFFSLVDDPQK